MSEELQILEVDEKSSSASDSSSSECKAKKQKVAVNIYKKKQKHRNQKYRKEWENHFPKWLQPIKDNNYRAQCLCCNIEFRSDLTIIKRHANGPKHLQAVKKIQIPQKTLINLLQSKPLEKNIRRAELKLCAFLSEHNISFLTCDHLIPLLKDCFPDSAIVKGLALARTKATGVTKNIIAKISREELVALLKNTKFSILIDESTDIASIKTMAICVRFYMESKGIISRFFALVQIFSSADTEGANEGATAEKLYTEMLNAFTQQEIPLTNIIGFASDGCNAMMGEFNSVASRLRRDFPGIFISKCICHSLHLCASEACNSLPRGCEGMARDIYNFFNSSSKRQAQYSEFQNFCHVEPHKLLRPSQTRWLSLLSVVKRILEQWNPLLLYFTQNYIELRLVQAENIYRALGNTENKLFFYFLDWVLPKFVTLNEFFQSEKVVITSLYSKVCNTYKDLLLLFMVPDYINKADLNDIDPNDQTKYIPLSNIYLGVNVIQNIDNLSLNQKNDFWIRCRQFLVTGCNQIKKRFNFNDLILRNITILNHSQSNHNSLPNSIFSLLKESPRIINNNDFQKIDDEWRKLLNTPDIIKTFNHLDIDKYWMALAKLEDGNGNKEYKNVASFALTLLCYPHSNATCERVFSKINLVKTKCRNRLLTETVEAVILISEHISNNTNNFDSNNTSAGTLEPSTGKCYNFEPSQKMINLMNSSTNIYQEKSRKTVVDNIAANQDLDVFDTIFDSE